MVDGQSVNLFHNHHRMSFLAMHVAQSLSRRVVHFVRVMSCSVVSSEVAPSKLFNGHAHCRRRRHRDSKSSSVAIHECVSRLIARDAHISIYQFGLRI